MKIMGIDYGEAKTGIAIGDTEVGQSWPYKIIRAKSRKELIREIKEIFESENISKIVIGAPLCLNGDKGNHYPEVVPKNKQMEKVLQFAEDIKEKVANSIVLEDERLSTKMAVKIKRGVKRKEKADDDISAMIILQGYLERREHG